MRDVSLSEIRKVGLRDKIVPLAWLKTVLRLRTMDKEMSAPRRDLFRNAAEKHMDVLTDGICIRLLATTVGGFGLGFIFSITGWETYFIEAIMVTATLTSALFMCEMMVAVFLSRNLIDWDDLTKSVIESDERYRILTNAERAGLPSFEVERLAVLLDLRHRSQENNLGLNFSPRDEALLTRVLALPNEPQEYGGGVKLDNLTYDAAPPKSFRLG